MLSRAGRAFYVWSHLNLAGCDSWGCRESDTTEQLNWNLAIRLVLTVGEFRMYWVVKKVSLHFSVRHYRKTQMRLSANPVHEFSVATSHLLHVCMCALSCGSPFPTPGDFPNPGIELISYTFCIGRWILYLCATWEAPIYWVWLYKRQFGMSFLIKKICSFVWEQ